MSRAALPPRPAPPPGWALMVGGDCEPSRMRARIGRWLRRFIAAAELHDEWLDRRAAERLKAKAHSTPEAA